jgi:hypothetical protein
MRQYGRSLPGILFAKVLVSRTLAHKGYAQWYSSRWSGMPMNPLGAYQPILSDVIEQSWSRWIPGLCLWILPDHWLAGGMEKIYSV